MAYSRWGNSIWYTFWCYSYRDFKFPTQKLKNTEIFEICDFPSFLISYGDLKTKGIDVILKDVNDFYTKEHNGSIFDSFVNGKITFKDTTFDAKNPTPEEIEELRGYLTKFIDDVDDYYKWKNFFYFEWYLTLHSKINNLFLKK